MRCGAHRSFQYSRLRNSMSFDFENRKYMQIIKRDRFAMHIIFEKCVTYEKPPAQWRRHNVSLLFLKDRLT